MTNDDRAFVLCVAEIIIAGTLIYTGQAALAIFVLFLAYHALWHVKQ